MSQVHSRNLLSIAIWWWLSILHECNSLIGRKSRRYPLVNLLSVPQPVHELKNVLWCSWSHSFSFWNTPWCRHACRWNPVLVATRPKFHLSIYCLNFRSLRTTTETSYVLMYLTAIQKERDWWVASRMLLPCDFETMKRKTFTRRINAKGGEH